MAKYEPKVREDSKGAQKTKEVHYWRPPCSCGVELGDALKVESPKYEKKEKVHFWRPPCSCGVSLDKVLEEYALFS